MSQQASDRVCTLFRKTSKLPGVILVVFWGFKNTIGHDKT